MNKSERRDTIREMMAITVSTCAILAAVFMLTGCATTYTTGAIDPATKQLKFRSTTSAFGNAAIENSKSIEFLVEDGDGFHIEASGNSSTTGTSELDIPALSASIAAAIGQVLAR